MWTLAGRGCWHRRVLLPCATGAARPQPPRFWPAARHGAAAGSWASDRLCSSARGVLLVVDANEGIQAQTVANFFLAFEAQLSIIPVINKTDLKNAHPERVEKQIEKVFDIPSDDCIKISAKLGTNVEHVLQAVIERIPLPKVHRKNPLRVLVFDSTFDQYRGVIANVVLFDGVGFQRR
ncbi:GTP-binding protein GUF1-like protein [Heterocephalus glaber]|uniref:GTP-binding protein GUF1-like protein n=1 Tax=Heterocephalus glaber TaxID=10181 RepID=G5BMK9_HETGA|nr:GTP-binding protein GUF1-like protein [Heterocephalus glaber]